MGCETHVQFTFRLGEPSVAYILGAGRRSDDLLAVSINAHCLGPEPFAGRAATIHLQGARTDPAAGTPNRKAVGFIQANKRLIEASISVPQNDCWGLLSAVQSGAIRYMSTEGGALVRGHALLDMVVFEGASSEIEGRFNGE